MLVPPFHNSNQRVFNIVPTTILLDTSTPVQSALTRFPFNQLCLCPAAHVTQVIDTSVIQEYYRNILGGFLGDWTGDWRVHVHTEGCTEGQALTFLTCRRSPHPSTGVEGGFQRVKTQLVSSLKLETAPAAEPWSQTAISLAEARP